MYGPSGVPTRRRVLAGAASLVSLALVRPGRAAEGQLTEALAGFAEGREIRRGRVKLDLVPLVENGNTVPLTVTVESPMTAEDHVAEIAIFNERNPQPDVARFHLGPRAGRASVSTRMRLATSQNVVAVARMADGSLWSDEAYAVVTLAACLEG